MKDEIKLKDMTDFIENIYKNIKKQPTLEEELEKERKFINKIKGDNEDEVKELLKHIEILDNTDYILHSDKAKALLDYITKLQSNWNSLRECIIGIIEEARDELNTIIHTTDINTEDGLKYVNQCSREFNVIRKNLEIALDKMNELEGKDN